ncbi:MAG: rod shape-determining protein RodA [Opitutaceae bacterium]|nr:rod shape-determining protein RodA [Opitutaceae bacterium]
MQRRPQPAPLSRFLQVVSKSRFDLITPSVILFLGIIGIFFIYSAQLYSGETLYKKQIVWLILGVVAYVILARIDYKYFLIYSHWIYLLALIALLLIWSPLGLTRGGSSRWLNFGVFLFQPVEAAKFGVLIMSASILARSEIGSIKESLMVLGKMALAVSIPMLLILLQPDLGSALVLPPMVFSLLFVSNLATRFFIASIAIVLLLVGIVAVDVYRYNRFLEENNLSPMNHGRRYEKISLLPLRDYQRNRILSFVAPDKIDPNGIGWNLRQSLISVGSGGLTGKGWTEGTQAKLGYLPRGVAHNDFIFPVLAEEKGFIGSVTVLALFGLILGNGIRIAGMARDRFGTLLALGVTTIFAIHVFVNIAMTIGLIPITGLPLPFLSYSGSFFLSCCIFQGLVQSVYRFRRDF